MRSEGGEVVLAACATAAKEEDGEYKQGEKEQGTEHDREDDGQRSEEEHAGRVRTASVRDSRVDGMSTDDGFPPCCCSVDGGFGMMAGTLVDAEETGWVAEADGRT